MILPQGYSKEGEKWSEFGQNAWVWMVWMKKSVPCFLGKRDTFAARTTQLKLVNIFLWERRAVSGWFFLQNHPDTALRSRRKTVPDTQ